MSGLFAELRRRGVLGALVAYGVAAAGALQLADIVVHNLGLPGWTLRALIWLAAAGLVATGVVSWFYDLTRRGFVRTVGPGQGSRAVLTPPSAAPGAPAREVGPGTVLAGRYRVERELGKGAMGRVLVARDEKLGRRVAVKIVTAAADPARVRRFEQEARTAGSLEHPNVLAVYDLGEESGVPFLVTELLAGHTLRTVIAGPRLPPEQAQGLLLQLARGLAAAHSRGIVHRDVKPENLFLTDDGRLKILDFGLARLIGDGEQGPALTITGAVFGSPGYLSPEQARGEKVGPPSDVFSAGAVIYEMLSGRRAFPGDSLIEAGHAALESDPPPLPASVPRQLAAVVMRCLEKEPQRRFQGGAALVAAVEALAPAAPVTLPPRPGSWRRSTSLMVALALVAIGAALASGARVLRSSRTPRVQRQGPALPDIPRIPIPPPPPIDGHADEDRDVEGFARDIRREVEASTARAGGLAVIAGARALERAHRVDRAQAVLRRSRDPAARLELFLLQRKQGAGDAAESELKAFAGSLAHDRWPAPLVRLYLGEIGASDAIAAASDDEERCEAHYYLGRLHLEDDPSLARSELERVARSRCDRSELAKEDLQALQRR